MTSKLIDKLTKFCFHSASPTTPASLTHNPQQATPTTPLGLTPNPSPNGEGRDYRNRPVVRNNKTKFYRLYRQILFILYTQSLFVIMLFCLQKNHLSPFVIMSFCLKKTSVFICYYVILSSRIPLSSSVPLLFCLKTFLCLRPSPCYSVSHIFCLSDVEMSLQRGV